MRTVRLSGLLSRIRALGAMSALLVTVPLVSGCMTGLIYTDVTSPLTFNMKETPALGESARTKNRGFRIPFTRVPVSAQWHTSSVGEAAKANGLSEFYYADIRRISILGGVWQDSILYVVGKRNGETVTVEVPMSSADTSSDAPPDGSAEIK